MNCDQKKAKSILDSSAYTCVLIRESEILTSSKRGVSPLLDWLDSGKSFEGFSAADKVVGKAAAYLYVLLGIRALYTKVISSQALEVLSAHNVEILFGEKVDRIRNRDNTGFCPMELCVADVDTADGALTAIRNKLAEFSLPCIGDGKSSKKGKNL